MSRRMIWTLLVFALAAPAVWAGLFLFGLSAIVWSLMIVVTLKYVTLVLRASNRGATLPEDVPLKSLGF